MEVRQDNLDLIRQKMMEEENEAKVFQPDFFQLQPSSP